MEEWRRHYDINVFSGLALVRFGPLGWHAKYSIVDMVDYLQVKAALPELKKTKGCALWVSSGAATAAYTAWGAYGSAKAAMNQVSAHFAVENPEITSVAMSPGRVDTDMQKLIREDGKSAMAESDYTSFAGAYTEGKLVKPEQPGNVMARFVVDPDHALSGKLVK